MLDLHINRRSSVDDLQQTIFIIRSLIFSWRSLWDDLQRLKISGLSRSSTRNSITNQRRGYIHRESSAVDDLHHDHRVCQRSSRADRLTLWRHHNVIITSSALWDWCKNIWHRIYTRSLQKDPWVPDDRQALTILHWRSYQLIGIDSHAFLNSL